MFTTHDDLSTRTRLALGTAAAAILFGVWLGKAWWFFALGVIALGVAIAGARRCGFASYLALIIASVSLVATGLEFVNGPSITGGILAGLIAAGTFMTATLDFCLPCEIAHLFAERKPRPAQSVPGADEPTLLMTRP